MQTRMTCTTAVAAPTRAPTPPVAPFSSRLARSAAAAAAAALLALPAYADLNTLEAAAGGEFGRGTAQQFGEATLNGQSFDGKDLTRSNFTSAEAKKASFKGARLVGSYMIKG